MRPLARAILALALCVPAAHAQSQVVKVTVPKANVRSEPNDKAPVLQQATPNDQIEWRATEGDWFKVLLPPNPALGGARVEAYISRKVSKLAAAPAVPPSAAPSEAAPTAPTIDTHAANVFLGSIVDGTLLRQMTVQIVHAGNRDAWTILNAGDWTVASDRRPSLVVSIGDRAGFSTAGLAPTVVKLSPAAKGMNELVVGSMKGATGDKDWKADEMRTDATESTAGVWNVKLGRDLKPGNYAIVMRPSNSKATAPQIVWAFTVK